MRETSILDHLNCKTQAHARVCKENKEKKWLPIKIFFIESTTISCLPKILEKQILLRVFVMMLQSIKVLMLHCIYYWYMQQLSIGTHQLCQHSFKHNGSVKQYTLIEHSLYDKDYDYTICSNKTVFLKVFCYM